MCMCVKHIHIEYEPDKVRLYASVCWARKYNFLIIVFFFDKFILILKNTNYII